MIDLLWNAWAVLWDVAAVIGLLGLAITTATVLTGLYSHHKAVRSSRAAAKEWREFARRHGMHKIKVPKEWK